MNNHFLAEVFAITKKKGSGGGSSAIDVQSGANLIDYDGSIVQHYSKEEFLALSAMPSNPSHDGLVAQGWNWTLEDAKTYIEKYGSVNIGQMYITDTGDTRIYIHIDEDTPQNRLTFYVRFTSSIMNNAVIDWGDGTVNTVGFTSVTNFPHNYTTGGDYVIKIKVNEGTISFDGSGTTLTSGYSIYGNRDNQHSYNRGRITRIECGSGVTSIGISALFGCYALTSITIPNSVTDIKANAFNSCYSLTSITIPNSVTNVRANVFQYCYSLASSIIPHGITIIEASAFSYCNSLMSITVPDGVTSIANSVFYNCYSLASITIPSSVISIGENVFNGCYSLALIIIPDDVTSIGNSAFANCYSLMSITIPNSVTSIGNSIFQNCYSLTSITILGSVTSIGTYVFQNCYSLISITIPNSVTSIGSTAFSSCYGISEYHLLKTTPPTLASTNVFNNIASDCKIYVPYSADHSILDAYKAATNWSTYASYMVEEPQT